MPQQPHLKAFPIHTLAHHLLNPLLHFWLALLVGLFFYYRGPKKISRMALGYALAWLFLISTTPLPVYLAKQREGRHPVLWQIPDSIQRPIDLFGGS